jgi:LAGLIDADG endonuclease
MRESSSLNSSKKPNNKNRFKQLFFNFISITLLVFIFYKFVIGLSLSGLLGLIISAIISFLISNFILNKFKFSNNKFIKVLQIIVLINIICIIAFLICDYFNIKILSEIWCDADDNNYGSTSNTKTDNVILKSEQSQDGEVYHLTVKKSTVDKITDAAVIGGKTLIGTIAPNIGAGAAAGASASAMVKMTAGIPPLQRSAIVGGTAAVTAAGTLIGLEAGKAISKNINISEAIKNSRHGDPNIERVPSPDINIINSPLEINDDTIPLEVLLNSLYSLNILELFLFLILLFLIVNRYFYKFNMENIYNLIRKIMPVKFMIWYLKSVNKSIEYNTKFTNIMFIIIIILLIVIKLGNLYISFELSINTDNYVQVYNHLKNTTKTSILILGLSKSPLDFNLKYIFTFYKFKFINISSYLFYYNNRVVKMLLSYEQFAWIINFIIHQRLNVEHPSKFNNGIIKHNNLTCASLSKNKILFYQWLVGFTDGVGNFSITYQNSKWSLTYKLSQHQYNIRLLYFIKRQLGVGNINKEIKTNMTYFIIKDKKMLANIIFPIFDKYPLLTSKYFYYIKFKEAYKILEDANLTKNQKDDLIFSLLKKNPSEDYISPVWNIVNNSVINTNDAIKVLSKAWLIGFIEAEGCFYLINKSKNILVHGFEIIQKLDLIVLSAIAHILGIRSRSKRTYNFIVTTNSRSIENIIKYCHKTMKGLNSLSFKLWLRAYNILKLNKVSSEEKKYNKIYKINKLLNKINSKLKKSENFILSNKFNRSIHTNVNNSNLNPIYISGFYDAEATFLIAITKRSYLNVVWGVSTIFRIELHSKELPLINLIKSFLKDVGNIDVQKTRNSVAYTVNSVKDINNIIIPHF